MSLNLTNKSYHFLIGNPQNLIIIIKKYVNQKLDERNIFCVFSLTCFLSLLLLTAPSLSVLNQLTLFLRLGQTDACFQLSLYQLMFSLTDLNHFWFEIPKTTLTVLYHININNNGVMS